MCTVCKLISILNVCMLCYTGSVQTFTAPSATTYKLEVWGAQGGTNSNGGATGGLGGYSIGKIINNSNLYICVGGTGGTASSDSGASGGYNGGGNGGTGSGNCRGGGGGGGATHIATNNRGVLANYKNNQSEVLLVAGGGGGATAGGNPIDKSPGGSGGGTNGGNSSTLNSAAAISQGATQNSGYSFGQGQNGITSAGGSFGMEGNGGGGGGWYGGYSYQGTGNNSNAGGGGGSGYLNTSRITNSSTTAGVQTGNGKALITWMPVL